MIKRQTLGVERKPIQETYYNLYKQKTPLKFASLLINDTIISQNGTYVK